MSHWDPNRSHDGERSTEPDHYLLFIGFVEILN